MILKLVKSNSLLASTLPALIGMVLWIGAYCIHGLSYVQSNVSFFSVLFSRLIHIPFAAFAIGLGLLIAQAYMLNTFTSKHGFLGQITYLPALLCILLCSCRPTFINFYPALAASFFLILAFKRITESYKKEKALSEAFDTGLFAGLAALVYYPAFVFLIFFWLALFTIRPAVWREWLVLCIGFVLIFVLAFGYDAVFYSPQYFWHNALPLKIGIEKYNKAMDTFSWQQITLIAIVGLTVIISLPVFIGRITGNTVKNRKLSTLLIGYVCFVAISVIIAPEKNALPFELFAVPFSCIFSKYFIQAKSKWLPGTLFMLFIAAVVLNIFF